MTWEDDDDSSARLAFMGPDVAAERPPVRSVSGLRDAANARGSVAEQGMAGSTVGGSPSRRPVSVTIAKSLRYIAPSMRAEGEGPYRLTGTKTGETREVPLPRFVADMLAERLVRGLVLALPTSVTAVGGTGVGPTVVTWPLRVAYRTAWLRASRTA